MPERYEAPPQPLSHSYGQSLPGMSGTPLVRNAIALEFRTDTVTVATPSTLWRVDQAAWDRLTPPEGPIPRSGLRDH